MAQRIEREPPRPWLHLRLARGVHFCCGLGEFIYCSGRHRPLRCSLPLEPPDRGRCAASANRCAMRTRTPNTLRRRRCSHAPLSLAPAAPACPDYSDVSACRGSVCWVTAVDSTAPLMATGDVQSDGL
eukprot:scaffold479_cov119-Isochrysis_galbana.AAC.5